MKRFALRGLAATTTLLLVVGITVTSGGTAIAAPPITPTPTITSKPAAFVNVTTASFSFTDSTSSATFKCSLDGAAATSCVSPVTYTGLSVAAHTFSLKAQATPLKLSKAATASWTIDQTSPTTPTVSQPTSPSNSTNASITFSSPSADVQSYECSLDGAAAAACTSPKSLTALADGVHTFAVRAIDKAGNTSGWKTVTWTVDTSIATPFITSAPPSTSTGSVSFGFGSTDSGVTFSCSMDSTTNASYGACTSSTSYTGLGNGSHTFRVRTTDAAGNVSTPAAYTWKVAAAPTIALSWTNPVGLPAANSNSSSGAFAFSATGQTTLACRLDGVDQATCTTPESVTGLGDGQHTYALVANAGLPSQTTLSYTWEVDTVAPGSPTVSGPSGRVGTPDADVVVSPADISDDLACEVDGVSTPCDSLSLTGLADGDHTVDATESDAAGNTAGDSLTWTVDTTGPVGTPSAPNSLTGAFSVVFDEDVTGVDAASLLLTDEAGADLGATEACFTSGDVSTACAASDVRTVKLTAPSALMLGQYYRVQVNPVGSEFVTDDLGNVGGTVDSLLRGPTSASESAVGGSYTWRKAKNKKATGGSYFLEHRKTAKASWSFKGKAVSWLTETGPTYGKADVYIDGVRKATVNNFAKTANYGIARNFKGLAPGTHTIEIRVLGKKGAKAGKGTYVSIDGFRVGKTVTATPVLSKVAWQRALSASAQDGAYAVADLKAQTTKATFRGTSVTVRIPRGPTNGKAAIYVDGVLKQTMDLYSKNTIWSTTCTVGGLADSTHTVLVKVLGAKNTKSTGTAVMVDGFSVS